jgi:uncharacterized RDD family membrane protein YckC
MQSNYSILTAQNVQLELPLASIGDRFIAYIIDIFIKIGYLIFLQLTGLLSTDLLLSMAFSLPLISYHLVMEYFNEGQSIGKSLMNIRVASLDGDKVSFGSYLIRWVFRIVDFNLFSPIVALISVSISDQNQRIGDRFANTTIISLKEKEDLGKTTFVRTDPDHNIAYPEAEYLSYEQVQLIRDTLKAYNVENRQQLIGTLARKVADHLGRPAPEKDYAFLMQVLKDYNYIKKQELR